VWAGTFHTSTNDVKDDDNDLTKENLAIARTYGSLWILRQERDRRGSNDDGVAWKIRRREVGVEFVDLLAFAIILLSILEAYRYRDWQRI